ncbi:MAG: DUF6290 family protein, partial [Clostridium sp.]
FISFRSGGVVKINRLVELLKKIFGEEVEESVLDARLEVRVNSKEKQLIKKYCQLKQTNCSNLVRSLLMKEIDTFINNL